MSLTRVPQMRKVSVLSIIGTVAFLMFAASIPQLRIPLAVLAIAINSLPYIFLALWSRRGRRSIYRDIWVRELTPEAVRKWYAAGRITEEEYERMMRNLESRE